MGDADLGDSGAVGDLESRPRHFHAVHHGRDGPESQGGRPDGAVEEPAIEWGLLGGRRGGRISGRLGAVGPVPDDPDGVARVVVGRTIPVPDRPRRGPGEDVDVGGTLGEMGIGIVIGDAEIGHRRRHAALIRRRGHPVIGGGIECLHRGPVVGDVEVEVGLGTDPRTADQRDPFAGGDRVARPHGGRVAGEVKIRRRPAIPVVDDDVIRCVVVPTRLAVEMPVLDPGHDPCGRREDRDPLIHPRGVGEDDIDGVMAVVLEAPPQVVAPLALTGVDVQVIDDRPVDERAPGDGHDELAREGRRVDRRERELARVVRLVRLGNGVGPVDRDRDRVRARRREPTPNPPVVAKACARRTPDGRWS